VVIDWFEERESVIDRPWVFIYLPAGGFSSTSACRGLGGALIISGICIGVAAEAQRSAAAATITY